MTVSIIIPVYNEAATIDTLLPVFVQKVAQIGGKLAQLGQRLINSAAKKTADDFFVKFAAAVAAGG